MSLSSAPLTEDHELRAHAQHHASLRLWLRLLSCTTLVEDDVRQRLREHFELSRRMMVSGGNITVIVDQLEKEHLVQRQVAATDRRSFRVLLTPTGRKSFTRMASQHEQWVVDLFSGLSKRQQEQLYALLGHLKTSLHQHK